MPHSYRVTVQSLTPVPPADTAPSITFDVANHDEILGLAERIEARGILPQEEAAEFTVGLKLFSEVMLRHRRDPLFAELFPHFGAFMKRLKGDAPFEAAQG
jgi:hypothetical protein